MRTAPSLLTLTIHSAVVNISHIPDLSPLPDHIVLDILLGTLRAGKLTERVLKLFVATGKEEVLSLIQALNIQQTVIPVLPTNSKFIETRVRTISGLRSSTAFYGESKNMSELNVMDEEIDIVIGALSSDMTSFMNEWRPIFSRYHLIIIKDPDLKEELQIPQGFNLDIYSKSDINRLVGAANSLFSGYSCRYFGYLISRKKYIISVDDDCFPAKDDNGGVIDIVSQHIANLKTPATPFFFNTLYDPFRNGADFVRGYPFSLRTGVTCALSCGLWMNLADFDAPTQALKAPTQKNTRYVDAVLTVPTGAMMPLSGINIGFDRELVGPALCPALKLRGEGKFRWETMEDMWGGLCAKVICDHLKVGVKSGLPYVWRNDRGSAIESLRKEWEGVKLMEEVVPFFQAIQLPQSAITPEDCMVEIAKEAKEKLGRADPIFSRAAEAMLEWVRLWKRVGLGELSGF